MAQDFDRDNQYLMNILFCLAHISQYLKVIKSSDYSLHSLFIK